MPNNQAPPGVGIRRGSPVFGPDGAGTVDEVEPTTAWATSSECRFDCYVTDELRLDLTDPTGRMHAAWAILAQLAETHIGIGNALTRPHAGPIDHGGYSAGTMCVAIHHPDMPSFASSFRGPDWTGQTVGTFRIAEELRGLQGSDDATLLGALMRHVFGDDNAK